MLFTCAHPLEVLIVRPLPCSHDPGALIFEHSPEGCRYTTIITPYIMQSHDLLIHKDGIMHIKPILQPEAMHKIPKTPMQCGSCASAMCKCHYYNVILSEYGTKEITSAPLGLISVQCVAAEEPEYRSARAQRQIIESFVYFNH